MIGAIHWIRRSLLLVFAMLAALDAAHADCSCKLVQGVCRALRSIRQQYQVLAFVVCLAGVAVAPSTALGQSSLPQGLTCGLSYLDTNNNYVPEENACNGTNTVHCEPAWYGLGELCSFKAAAGYEFTIDGDASLPPPDFCKYPYCAGFMHQRLVDGVTCAPDASTCPDSTNFVLPRGAACGFHSTFQSPPEAFTCMGFAPGQDPSFGNIEPRVAAHPGCPDGWGARRAFDMGSGSGWWVWCEYEDPNGLSGGGPKVGATGLVCGLGHNDSSSGGGPFGDCMGFDWWASSRCPNGTKVSGRFDDGEPSEVGLGFCTITSNTLPPPSPPRGYLETTVSTDGNFGGWAFDPGSSPVSIFVDLYVDGSAGSGAASYRVVANVPRPDVNSAWHIRGNHGFNFTLPSQYSRSVNHTVYAYGIALFGQGDSQLTGSPGKYKAPAVCPTGTRNCDGRCLKICP
jgi:hypothetical protein